MKVCKFEKIKNEEEIIRIIDCIRNEHPHVVVIPTAIPLQKWLQKISASWFHHEDETSHSIINTIEEYYYTLADHLITSNKLNPLAELSQCILDSSNGSIINVI